jgi:hypothetical protein
MILQEPQRFARRDVFNGAADRLVSPVPMALRATKGDESPFGRGRIFSSLREAFNRATGAKHRLWLLLRCFAGPAILGRSPGPAAFQAALSGHARIPALDSRCLAVPHIAPFALSGNPGASRWCEAGQAKAKLKHAPIRLVGHALACFSLPCPGRAAGKCTLA